MAQATIQGAIDEIIAEIRGVAGVNFAPDDPEDQINAWPAAIVYNTDGESKNEPPDVAKDLHNVTIAVVMPLSEMRIAAQTMLALYEPIRNAIYKHRNSRNSQHYQTFETLTYVLGPIEWPQGQVYYGYTFTIGGLKIQNEI